MKSLYWDIVISSLKCEQIKVVISNVTTLRFLLIIDKKKIEGEKDGELKACDAGSLSGESSKSLSVGIIYFIICVSTLNVTSEITV